MKTTTAPSFCVRICIAGNRVDAARICREHCLAAGLCVTLENCDYIYTGGAESGVVVGLINYPRFPSTPEQITAAACVLGTSLMLGLSQQSFCVVTPTETIWHSRRSEDERR